MPRRMHPTFSFETSNAPDWYGDVRLCRTGLNPHFLFVLPKRLPGFPAELYRFGTEKPRGYSLLKRECPPRPPKEKRGGISISPRTPLKRHKGAGLRTLPFGNPSRGYGASPYGAGDYVEQKAEQPSHTDITVPLRGRELRLENSQSKRCTDKFPSPDEESGPSAACGG